MFKPAEKPSQRNIVLATKSLCIYLMMFCSSALLADTKLANTSLASTKTMPIEEIVVEVARSDQSLFESPSTITVIDSQVLEKNLVRSLPEALIEVPGVMVQKTANGQGSPFVRGFTGYRTLTLIDGIRYNNSVYRDGPNEYFSLIDFHSLEQIELLSGPSSAAYGSDAIGGTLSLKTKSSDFRNKESGRYFLDGSQSFRTASAEHSQQYRTELDVGNGSKWGVTLGYSKKGFGDIRAADLGTLPTTDYDEYSYDIRFDIDLNNKWALTIVNQKLAQDDVWRTHSTIFSVPFSGTDIGADLLRLKDQKRNLNYLKVNALEVYEWLDSATLTLSHQRWDENGDRIKSNGERINDYFDSQMTGLELQLQSDTTIGNFVYGIDVYRDKVETGRVDFYADNSIDQIHIQGPVGDDAEYDQWGFYLQGEFFLNDQLTLTLGSRYSYVRASVGKYEDPQTELAASYKDHWGALTSSARISFQPNTVANWNLWGGISQAFRAPNIADVSRFGKSRSSETEVAATNLDPEHFLTYELGSKTHWNNSWFQDISLSVTAYYTDIRDFISSTPTGNIVDGLTEVSKQNSADGSVKGIEITSDWQLSDQLSATANMTWLRGDLDTFSETKSNQSVSEPMSRIMPFTTHLSLFWISNNHDYWSRLHIIRANKADRLSSADQQDLERIPPDGTPAYTLVNLNSGWEISQHLQLTVGINNLFNKAYRSHGSGTNEPGRSFNMGIKASF